MKDHLLRSLLPTVRIARLVHRLGDVRSRGPLPRTSELAADTGEPFEVVAQLLDSLEAVGWVRSIDAPTGQTWQPTARLPAVDVDYEVPAEALAGRLLSAALTANLRGLAT